MHVGFMLISDCLSVTHSTEIGAEGTLYQVLSLCIGPVGASVSIKPPPWCSPGLSFFGFHGTSMVCSLARNVSSYFTNVFLPTFRIMVVY